jgi:hypothetical protein
MANRDPSQSAGSNLPSLIERTALRARALIQWAVAGSVLVFGLSALVGFVATGEEFDWELGTP